MIRASTGRTGVLFFTWLPTCVLNGHRLDIKLQIVGAITTLWMRPEQGVESDRQAEPLLSLEPV